MSFVLQGAVLTHKSLIANSAGSSIDIKFYPSDVLVILILFYWFLFAFAVVNHGMSQIFSVSFLQLYIVSTFGPHL